MKGDWSPTTPLYPAICTTHVQLQVSSWLLGQFCLPLSLLPDPTEKGIVRTFIHLDNNLCMIQCLIDNQMFINKGMYLHRQCSTYVHFLILLSTRYGSRNTRVTIQNDKCSIPNFD